MLGRKSEEKNLKEETLRFWDMAEAERVFQRRVENQRKDGRGRLQDANGKRNEWEDRRTISVLACTVAGRSSDSDGRPWPLNRMYKRHRQWILLLHGKRRKVTLRKHLKSWPSAHVASKQWLLRLSAAPFPVTSETRLTRHTTRHYNTPCAVE